MRAAPPAPRSLATTPARAALVVFAASLRRVVPGVPAVLAVLPVLAVLVVLVAVGYPARAAAYEERATLELGLSPSIRIAPGAEAGGAFDVITAWGLGEQWSVGGSLRYAWHHDDAMRNVVIPALELTWALDIVRFVPRATIGVGAAVPLERGAVPELDLLVRIGFDRLTDRGFIGFDLRADVYGTRVPSGTGRLSLGLGLRWGFVFERF